MQPTACTPAEGRRRGDARDQNRKHPLISKGACDSGLSHHPTALRAVQAVAMQPASARFGLSVTASVRLRELRVSVVRTVISGFSVRFRR